MPSYIGEDTHDYDLVNDLVRARYESFAAIQARDLVEGFQYSTGRLYENVAANGGVANLLAKNPSGSGVYLLVETRVITTGQFFAHKSLNVDVNSTGTQLQIAQRRSDIADGNETTAYYDVTVDETNAKVFNDKVVGSGSSTGTVEGSTFDVPEALIAPGHNIYLEAVNKVSSQQNCTIDVDFTEIPKDLVDAITDE